MKLYFKTLTYNTENSPPKTNGELNDIFYNALIASSPLMVAMVYL